MITSSVVVAGNNQTDGGGVVSLMFMPFIEMEEKNLVSKT